MSRGKEFEKFIDSLERLLNKNSTTTIEKDAHLQTKNGSLRQIDVLLTHRTDRHTFLTIIECKDCKRKVDMKVIDEFASKIKSVNAAKGILISKSGFTTGLMKEALAYPNINLYTIEEIDKANNEILGFDKIGYYRITYSSNDWTVRFVEKHEINNVMKLYSKLKFHETAIPFDITQIVQDYLSLNESFIVNKISEADKSGNTMIDAELTLDINLPYPAFFEESGSRTYVSGFRSIIKASVNINVFEIAGIYRYQNISKNETVALLLKLNLDEETKKLILEPNLSQTVL